jgi:probable rRNA maturation factor
LKVSSKITYHIEDLDFQLLKKRPLSNWIKKTVEIEGKTLSEVTYIFCSDNYLHKMNVEHLDHDTLTDIITFPYNSNPIEGDIFISIDRVKDNAEDFKTSFDNELHRVMIHGILHLCGYKDKTEEDEKRMRQKEDECLARLLF